MKNRGFIAGVLVLNTTIGAYREYKAEQRSHALRKLLQIRASVHREGDVREINAEQLVPGDVVWLESGHLVSLGVHHFPGDGTAQVELEHAASEGSKIAKGNHSPLRRPARRVPGTDLAHGQPYPDLLGAR